MPLRRNSGPEAEMIRMFGKKNKVSKNNTYDGTTNHYSLRIERKKKMTVQSNKSAEYLCQNTSSSESLDNLISSYKSKSRKGFSLDRNPQSADTEPKPKPKRSSWFLREKNRDKSKSNEKFNKRGSLDFTLSYDTAPKEEKARGKTGKLIIQRQNAADYSTNPTDSSTTPQEEYDLKKNSLSKFQIGKRFLKGEIGIKSFNYYLLKEGLKKNLLKQQHSSSENTKSTYISKSEENIYEEIFFQDQLGNVAVSAIAIQPEEKQEPPPLPPFTKQPSLKQKNSNGNEGNCMNCEICVQEAQKQMKCKAANCEMCAINHPQNNQPVQNQSSQNYTGNATNGNSGYGKISKKIDDNVIYEFFQQQLGQNVNVLQFQSYNPNNPNIYKIETTPVAFGDYNPIEEQIYQHEQMQKQQQQQQQQQYQGLKNNKKMLSSDCQMPHKSSSSSDSMKHHHHHHHKHPPASNEFYKRPNYYSTNEERQIKKHEPIYKTDSSASILSESNSIRSDNSLNRYNSQKSGSNHSRYAGTHPHDNMSDSSLGDSLFSYTGDASKRYFGSSESCRFGYECRRCSLETEKCSYSDTCRYECNLKNCDCSSSYFSSDFDDTNIYNNQNRKKEQIQNEQFYEQKANRYAKDFIKHVNNVKKRSQNLIYESNNQIINNQIITTSSIYEVPKSSKTLSTFETDIVDPTGTDNFQMLMATENETRVKENVIYSVIDDDMSKYVANSNSKGRRSTGTTPKVSSVSTDKSQSHTSISSNDSRPWSSLKIKRIDNEDKYGKTKEKEKVPPSVQPPKNDEKMKVETAVNKAPSEMKVISNKEKGADVLSSPKSKSNSKTNNAKERETKEKQKNWSDIEDDDDDVFLDNNKIKSKEKSTDRKTIENKMVSDI